ncbi:tetratricopeptide repeat protein [Paraburkholderia lacunae]|uniref:Uncharacterized protein n=1 Tax=Paraburkholderia lacunae TaxID=2211104 RepID=A0A370NCZ0_9BURK|nr:tetratricopeptide repeat protein [Paraburkholderia lacunae]RDK03472.1 hypothetical protein DLM46_08100 [Paraburkholderia lacunae]
MSPIDSDGANALVAQADAHFSIQRFSDAMSGYQNVLALRPRDAHALHRIGLVCVHQNEFEQAREYLKLAVQAAPDRAELYEHAGLLAALKHDYAEAERCYRCAIGLAGGTVSLHRNLADCLRLSGRLSAAMEHYRHAVEIDPALHHAIRAMARISTELGAIEDAAHYWLRAWELAPSSLQDGLDLIAALAKAGRPSQLASTLTEIRTRFADNAAALKSLSFVLNTHDRFSEALSVARQGLAIDPRHPLLYHNAARALSISGKTAESRPYSMEAARLLPDNPYMQLHLAGVQLALGEFEEGWKRYRWFYELLDKRTELVCPSFREWKGEPVAGCQFLLVGEQGRGDEIQFIRFAEWLHRQGATVDVLVSEPVAELAASMTGVRNVLTRLPSGPYHYWCHMLRMPEHMKLDLPMLPIVMPYLAARPEKMRHWAACIDAMSPPGMPRQRRRIGVVWAGGPYHVLDRYRSIRLEALKPLFALHEVSWYSVQKGEHEHESKGLANEYDLHTLGPAINDFTDTLAILHSLDLLITVDTSVAHLAGAAGLPVWVLIPACSDWRWLTDRTDSPWYPSMRLFRQQELGKWDPVIEEVRSELSKWFDA